MKILNLYPEDFAKHYDWIAVCDQLDIPPDSTSIELKISKVSYENTNELETEEDN
jgi:hypothetical protein